MGLLSKINEKRKKAQKKILNPFVKAAGKLSDKLIPNELRFMAPYAAGIGTLMLPPGWGPYMRALAASGINVAGQIAADETPIEDISDINAFSAALAGGLGALGSDQVAGSMRSGIERPMAAGPQEYLQEAARNQSDIGFLQGAENIGREGIASLSDYVTGTRDTLANLGKNPASLFKYEKDNLVNKLPGLTKAAGALGPTLSHGTADVAYEAAIDYKDEADRLQAEEEAQMEETTTANKQERADLTMRYYREAGHDEETIQAALETNDLSDFYEPPVEEEGAAQGGIIGLRNGGRARFAFGGIDEVVAEEPTENNLKQIAMGLSRFLGLPGLAMQGGMAVMDLWNDLNDEDKSNVLEMGKTALKYSSPASFAAHTGIDAAKSLAGFKDGGMLNLGGNEMDYRGGGFVPIGKKERADDVPARLSKNEFVMTADAVKAAGGGSVNKGAQRMYNVMNQLEARA